jgi:hypothetical protein
MLSGGIVSLRSESLSAEGAFSPAVASLAQSWAFRTIGNMLRLFGSPAQTHPPQEETASEDAAQRSHMVE